MIALLFLASALALGLALTRWLKLSTYRFELPAMAIALGFFAWTWISFLLALILPYTVSLSLTVIIAAFATIWLIKTTSPVHFIDIPGGRFARAAWAAFTIGTCALLGWLFWTHDLLGQNGAVYSGGSTWGDFGMHASLISHLANLPQLSLDFPLATGAKLTYPFLIDLLSSWYVIGGWSMHLAIFLPSLLLFFSLTQLIIGFGIRLFNRISGPLIGLGLLLFSGSAASIAAAIDAWRQSQVSLWSFIAHPPFDFTEVADLNLHVSNFICNIILPQRGFLIGLAIFGATMTLLYNAHSSHNRRLATAAGILTGLLPFMHPHTFVALMAVLVSLNIWNLSRNNAHKTFWLMPFIAALILAAPQYLWQALANSHGTGGHLALGWMTEPGASPISFWADNFGLVGIWLVILPLFLYANKGLRKFLPWYLPFFGLLVLANIYSPQPFAYDNLKLIVYVYLIGLIFAGHFITKLITKTPVMGLIFVPLMFIISAGGVLAVVRETQLHDVFWSPDDIAVGEWIKLHTSPNDVFISTDIPNHPVTTLAGRKIILGYRGWLYSYNLNYADREQFVSQVLAGNSDTASSEDYNAKYIIVNTNESPEWKVNTEALRSAYPTAYHNNSWTIYKRPAVGK